jgi:hypothetical protein
MAASRGAVGTSSPHTYTTGLVAATLSHVAFLVPIVVNGIAYDPVDAPWASRDATVDPFATDLARVNTAATESGRRQPDGTRAAVVIGTLVPAARTAEAAERRAACQIFTPKFGLAMLEAVFFPVLHRRAARYVLRAVCSSHYAVRGTKDANAT